jgi:hypothetical protein
MADDRDRRHQSISKCFSVLHEVSLARGVGHPLSYPPEKVKIFSIEKVLDWHWFKEYEGKIEAQNRL